jgi:predicted ribosome quality control (RQC) complex YloA/Tae2 family protein
MVSRFFNAFATYILNPDLRLPIYSVLRHSSESSVVLLPRKEFTSFGVAAVVRELKAAVLDSRINNIYQLDAKTLLLKLHKIDKPAFRLILEAGERLNLTAYTVEKPFTPPAFCMALRKHLRNAWLTHVQQYEFERVVILSFKVQQETLKLILELFGDGNVILVAENGEILQALVYKKMRDRNIVRGETFKFAPSAGKNPYGVSSEELSEGLKALDGVEVVRGVTRLISIGGVYSEEVLLRAGIDKTKSCDFLSEAETKAIFDSLQSLLLQVKNGTLEPCVVLDKSGGFVDVVPLRLRRYEGEGTRLQAYESFNEALDEFYVRVSAIEEATAGVMVDDLKREAERLGRVIADQESVLAEAEAKAKQYRSVGDAIYAHLADLQVLLDGFLAGKQSGKEWKTIVSEVLAKKHAGMTPGVFFQSFDSKGLFVNVCVDGLALGLDLRKTLFENAASFYERSKRTRQKMDGAKTALTDSHKRLVGVEARMYEAEAIERGKPTKAIEELAKRKVKRKEWFEKFRWFISSDGFLIVAGKDAVSNEVLIKKYTENSDVVFHADIVGAPFVVIKTGGKQPTEQCLREAGELAAAFSRGWREGFGSVDVYWVKPEQLSKGGPSGESVGRGAFVVRGGRNWIRGIPLRIAVGVATDEDKGTALIVGGPVDAVKAKTKALAIVVPGDFSGKELLKHVLQALAGKALKEFREVILRLPVEEIREFIPYGKGRVFEG